MKRNFNIPMKGFGGVPITENSKDSQGNAKTVPVMLASQLGARAIRRTVNKFVDYVLLMMVGGTGPNAYDNYGTIYPRITLKMPIKFMNSSRIDGYTLFV